MTSGHSFKYGGFIDCTKIMFKNEGIKSFYKGWNLSLFTGITATMSLLVLDKIGSEIKREVILIDAAL